MSNLRYISIALSLSPHVTCQILKRTMSPCRFEGSRAIRCGSGEVDGLKKHDNDLRGGGRGAKKKRKQYDVILV